MLTLGIPTLNRYDLLPKLLLSAEDGNLVPDNYLIVDNGRNLDPNFMLDYGLSSKIRIYTPDKNIGVAASWNYIIRETYGDERIISNDDLILDKTVIKNMIWVIRDGGLIAGINGAGLLNIFSLFSLSDECVNRVGYFDEEISPDYGYFEDNDYYYRLDLAKIRMHKVYCNIIHEGSGTLKSYSEDEKKKHHEKFRIARNNYIKKWGGMPHYETFDKPFGK